ncbi:SIMPL domain-containing protein [Leptotrichia sp. oral taxon 847]|uniref:SIMPL domain-containing protein n=1 Tax=Leptotrichia sp. oral taxon 847 TaxID=1785996 RepID=UPI000AFE16C7|nr:SIMPL domain-containing protein [Leptotrichia sp. oral taxon 847]
MKKVQFIIISTILSFGLIVSAALIANAIDKTNKLDNRITVKGVAEKRIKSDKALIKIIISDKDENLDNLKKEIDGKEKVIIEKLKNLKISENDYNIENLKIQPNYDKTKEKTSQNEEASILANRILDYDGQEIISIVTGDIDKVKGFYENLLELKLQMENIEITKPEYVITNIEKYKKDLLIDATKNAEYRAIQMLKVNGNEINGLKNMTQGQFELLKDNEDILNKDDEQQNQIYKKCV